MSMKQPAFFLDDDPLKIGGTPKKKIRPYCMDCLKPYSEFGLDVVLTNQQWLLINPKRYGLLCAQCIVNRAEKLDGVIRCDLKLICSK